MNYSALSKKAKPVLFITAALQSLVFCAVVAAILFSNRFAIFYDAQLLLAAVCLLLAVAWAVAAPLLRFRRYRYLLAEDRIEIIQGIFFIRRTVVPIDRIHQIDIARGPIDSRFGLAKVTVTTAGATATLRFLELEKAEEICETLNAAIIQKIRSNRGDDNV